MIFTETDDVYITKNDDGNSLVNVNIDSKVEVISFSAVDKIMHCFSNKQDSTISGFKTQLNNLITEFNKANNCVLTDIDLELTHRSNDNNMCIYKSTLKIE